MPNGRPGDHPITDICTHRMDYFSPEVDELIRRCVEQGGTLLVERRVLFNQELCGPKPDLEGMRAELERILDELGTQESDAT